jgi:hypothetical protein
LYSNTSGLLNAKDYYTSRQNSFTTLLSTSVANHSNLDKLSTDKYLAYNFNIKNRPSVNSISELEGKGKQSDLRHAFFSKDIIDASPGITTNSLSLSKFDSVVFDKLTLNTTSDGKYHANPVRPLLVLPQSRKNATDSSFYNYTDLITPHSSDEIFSSQTNSSSYLLNKDLKSSNLGFLTADKNSRLINKIHSSKGHQNLSSGNTNLSDMMLSVKNSTSSISEAAVYDNANLL